MLSVSLVGHNLYRFVVIVRPPRASLGLPMQSINPPIIPERPM
jgi:hypothetical protein